MNLVCTNRCWLAAWLAVGAIPLPAAAADVQLRRECRPASSLITLGDLAEIRAGGEDEASRLAAIELFPAPAPGQKRAVRLSEVRQELARRGTNLQHCVFSGASIVTVFGADSPEVTARRDAQQLAQREQLHASLQKAIKQYLAEQGLPVEELVLTLDPADLPEGASGPWQIYGGRAPWTGRQEFVARGTLQGKAVEGTLAANVSLGDVVVVAANSIVRGAILQAGDLRLEVSSHKAAGETYFHSIDEVLGQEAIVNIGPDKPLTARSVRRPLLVRRGEVVTVRAISGGVTVETNARARNDGGQGDVIAVEAIEQKQNYLARVAGPQLVEVFARAAATPVSLQAPCEQPANPRTSQTSPQSKSELTAAVAPVELKPAMPVVVAAQVASAAEDTAAWVARPSASNAPAATSTPSVAPTATASAAPRPATPGWVKRRTR